MLALRDVYAGYGHTQILNGITLTVPKGKVIALLGGNGTGKSTVLKTICGLLRPTAGEIEFDGESIGGVPANRLISKGLCLVPQGKEIFAQMSVEENLLMGAYHRRADRAGIAADLERGFRQFPCLRERRGRPAGNLSGGERQMLSIGRALMARPRLLMLDEPSAALAPRIIEEIAESILRLNDDGMTILLVEQNVAMALAVSEYLYIVRDGAIAFERPVGDDREIDDLKAFYMGQEHG